jgi:hypothetical protein
MADPERTAQRAQLDRVELTQRIVEVEDVSVD